MSNFNHTGVYICECGKEFNNSQSFNGHKGHCEIHQLLKYNSLDNMHNHHRTIGDKSSITLSNKNKLKRELKLKQWVDEKHTCERCGKIMTKKYGSGRFCSAKCANTHEHSEETKKLLSELQKEKPIGCVSLEWRSNHPEQLRKNHSKRELEIVNFLKTNFPNDDWKQGFVSVDRVINDYYINPDLHSDKLKVIIEYDGIWHFKDIYNQLQHKQEVDRLTLKWCKDHNYRLIRIDEELNLTNEDIVNSIYNNNSDLELFNSNRYDYLFE